MASLGSYYRRAMGAIGGHSIGQMSMAWGAAGFTGAGLGLLSNSLGGLDQKVGSFSIPIDAVAGVALGVAAVGARSQVLKAASIAAIGHASVRFFEGMFHRHGVTIPGLHAGYDMPDLADLYPGHPAGFTTHRAGFGGFGGTPPYSYFGGVQPPQHDRLVEAAKYL